MVVRHEPDTIVAISTPPGRGGIGVVRLSGPNSCLIAAPILHLRRPLAHAKARYGNLIDTTRDAPQQTLDEVIVTLFAAPESYTTEDVVEIATHGSPVILDFVVRECMARGARLAEPGEFTQRAFLAGRLDLLQAEAIYDLIQSTTLHQAQLAASQLSGRLSKQLAPIKSRLLDLMATLEAGIDFAEDDVDVLSPEDTLRGIESIHSPLLALKRSFAYGSLVREGFSLAIAGRPNAGKSSLFNALLEQNRAIVTAQPGTTRDLITENLSLQGIPVKLTDTAGIRHARRGSAGEFITLDEAETLGIAKSKEAVAEADVILYVVDASVDVHDDDLAVVSENSGRPLLVVLNKWDLMPIATDEADQHSWTSTLGALTAFTEDGSKGAAEPHNRRTRLVRVSSLTGAGLSDLKDAIRSLLEIASPSPDAALISNLRQQEAVTETVLALEEAAAAARHGIPHEVFMIHLAMALGALDRLTGATAGDDILDRIFSTFCIGK